MIVNELSTVSAKWRNLGIELGLVPHPHSLHPPASLEEFLRYWLRLDRLKTWSHIVLALKSLRMGESRLGDHLKEKYLPGEALINIILQRSTVRDPSL